MKRWLLTMAILGGWAGLGALTASAQGYIPPQVNPNPTLPPALGLIPNNPYYQYFGLAQPQYQNFRTLQQLQMQVGQAGQTGYYPLGVGNPGLQPTINTGHPVTFQNLSHYYPAAGAQFAGMGGGGGYGAGVGGGGFAGGGFAGGFPNVNTPLPQGYAQFPR